MRTYTEKSRTGTYSELTEIKCDLCGKTTDSEWQDDAYDATEVKVKLATGERFPEGAWIEETEFDFCPDCFRDKLVPWVESQGGKPTKKKWDGI